MTKAFKPKPLTRSREWFAANKDRKVTCAELAVLVKLDMVSARRVIETLRWEKSIDSDHPTKPGTTRYWAMPALTPSSSRPTAAQQRLLELVIGALEGLRPDAAARELGVTVEHIGRLLRGLRALGLAEPVKGRVPVWTTPERAVDLRSVLRDRSLKAKRDLARRAKEREQAERAAEEAAEAWLTPSRRIVPASEAPPIRTRAVNSVFALGA